MLIPLSTLKARYGFNPTGIIHVGAHLGQEAKDYTANGVERVIWIEANPDIYQGLQKNISTYPNHMAINACISDKDGEEVEFFISSNEGQSSSFLQLGTHLQDHPEVSFTGSQKLFTARLDTLLTQTYTINLHAFQLLAMDLQCAEMHALKGFGDHLRNFKWIYLEVNKKETYKGCALIHDIDAYLYKFGFRRVATKWSGNTGWGDAAYAKR